jgi:hypothetical protein
MKAKEKELLNKLLKDKFGKPFEPGKSLSWKNKKEKFPTHECWVTTVEISGTQFDGRLSGHDWYVFPEIDDIYRIIYSVKFIYEALYIFSFEVYIHPEAQQLQIIIR